MLASTSWLPAPAATPCPSEYRPPISPPTALRHCRLDRPRRPFSRRTAGRGRHHVPNRPLPPLSLSPAPSGRPEVRLRTIQPGTEQRPRLALRGPEDLIVHTVTESLRLAAEAQAGEWEYLRLRIWPGTPKDSDDCQRGWIYCLDGKVGPTDPGTASWHCTVVTTGRAAVGQSSRFALTAAALQIDYTQTRAVAPRDTWLQDCARNAQTPSSLPCIHSSPRGQPEAAQSVAGDGPASCTLATKLTYIGN
jgi:hypothetical protein